MKFFKRFFGKQWFRQLLRYMRSSYMLALLAVVILLTGILCAEAGRETEELPADADYMEGTYGQVAEPDRIGRLSMRICDSFGNGRLFQEGVPVCIETDLYFTFPEEAERFWIRIGQQPFSEVSSDCYRLHYAQIYKLPAKQIEICFAAYDKDGRYMEQKFCFFVR